MALGKYYKTKHQMRCRCKGGVNKGQKYMCDSPCDKGEKFNRFLCDCFPDEPPCPNGASMVVTSNLSLKKGFDVVTTFVPLVMGVSRGAPARVVDDGLVQFHDGEEWIDVIQLPFTAGSEHEGSVIVMAISKAVVSSECF